MEIERKSLPKLPFGMEPVRVYFDGDMYHLICEDEHSVFDYEWNGLSASYRACCISLKIVLL